MNMPSKQRLVSLAAIIVLAILIIVGGTYLQKQKKESNDQSENDKTLEVGVKQEADEGKLVTEYPTPLIPQEDMTARLEDSYNLKDEQGNVERNATYTSDKTVKDIYDYYLDLMMTSKEYRIVNKEYAETQANIYANRPGKSDVSVYVKKDAETGKTVYTVSYLDRQ